jgi:phosphatidylinositol-3-phosphatase
VNRRLTGRLSVAVLSAAILALIGAPVSASDSGNNNGNNNDNNNGNNQSQHFFVIMMENTAYKGLIGNPNAPFINQAANTYGLATNYFGVSHPSQPNYIAATSGALNGVFDDNNITINVPNIVDQLEARDRTWKAYMQSLSLCTSKLAHDCGNQLYERKHNPFVSYADVQNNPARMANVVDLSQLGADLASGNVPNYSWISPDQCNDMHGRGGPPSDTCSFSHVQDLIATGDAFLKSTVSMIMSSDSWTDNSAIFITWDETDFPFVDVSGCCDAVPGGGHVVTLVITHSRHSHRTSDEAFNHYSLLATIQREWRLGCLANTCDTKNVEPMSDLLAARD